jgi:fido (protein-threonine AMPylation protein)
MSSQDFHLVKQGMFYVMDERLRAFQARQGDSSVKGRYESILADEWAVNDCRLDAVAASDFERAVENHQNATALMLSRPVIGLLDMAIIRDVHSMMAFGLSEEAGVFRDKEMSPLFENHVPVESAAIEAALTHLVEWTSADSFAELHPIQQTALVLIRLLDIYPFPDATPRTCRLLANGYLLGAGFPPAIFWPENGNEYQQAVQAGLVMDTSKLTAVLANSLTHIFDLCLEETAASG